jgi:hypothetical protein
MRDPWTWRESRVWIWDLGFGVLGLAFRVWDLVEGTKGVHDHVGLCILVVVWIEHPAYLAPLAH